MPPLPARERGAHAGEAAPDRRGRDRCLSPVLFVGVVVASIGGPLSLIALQVPAAVEAQGWLGWMTLASAVAFLPALGVWYGYSRHVASAGGLTAFTEAAAGPTVGRIQGALWIVSYALYIVYTIPQVVYEVLPAFLPVPVAAQPFLEVGIALGVGAVAVLPLPLAAAAVSVVAAGQVALGLLLGAATLSHAPALAGVPSAGQAALGSAEISLLYICGSLPLFLAGEVRGGPRAVSRGLLTGFGIAAVAILVGVSLVARAGLDADEPIPGLRAALAGGGPALRTAVGIGVAVSTTTIVLVELLALSRLLHHWFRRPASSVTRALAVALVAATALTLIDPSGIYEALLRPSLVALWLSQLIVFAVYPIYRRRLGHPRIAVSVGLAGIASALALFGLVSVLALPSSS
ncbi:MAG: hypothetical protein ACREQM_22845 [Candidatus Dormibacteraceae bacterium]